MPKLRMQATAVGEIMTAMTGDSYRLMRYRLVESIVPLSFAAEQLVAYSHAQDADLNDIVADFVDWTYDSVPGMVAEGLVPPELADEIRFYSTSPSLRCAQRRWSHARRRFSTRNGR
jgi:hypothetical protein